MRNIRYLCWEHWTVWNLRNFSNCLLSLEPLFLYSVEISRYKIETHWICSITTRVLKDNSIHCWTTDIFDRHLFFPRRCSKWVALVLIKSQSVQYSHNSEPVYYFVCFRSFVKTPVVDSAGPHRFYGTVSQYFIRSADRLAALVIINDFCNRTGGKIWYFW